MIKRYSDHAANERTFLAWVRTAIAIMAFGFLVEKFDLFLALSSLGEKTRAAPSHPLVGTLAGLALFALGGTTMALAALRFRRTARDIDSDEERSVGGERMDLALAGLLAILGATLFVYLAYTVFSRT
jgi:putative membrane protein